MATGRIRVAVLSLVLLAGSSSASDSAGAGRFVAWVYSHYPTADRSDGFDALGAAAKTIFHPSLLALIEEDERLANGEVGALDGDPLCDCQDDSGMTFQIRAVRAEGFSRATAIVVRREVEDPAAEAITLDLASVGGRWRVYDIHSKDTPSLRAFLIKSNAEARR